jgi:hypothetical protein
MALMGYALIAPEIMIFWAVRQHRAARYLAKRHKERGWTMAHAFFLIMGGFTLHDKRGTALRILEYRELETLSEAGKITWPFITEKEIRDRGKSDYLSKGIVLVQIVWFTTQFFARCRYNLGITELEIFTFSFTIVTVATYGLWWHKPLDVHCSVPVHLLENENIVSEGILSGSPAANPLSEPYPATSCEPVEGLESSQAHVSSQFLISEESQLPQQPLIVSELDSDPSPPGPNPNNATELSSHNNSTATSDTTDILVASIPKKHSISMSPIITLFTALIGAGSSRTLDHSVPLCMPTFYSPKLDNTAWEVALSRTIGMVFFISFSFSFLLTNTFASPFLSGPEYTACQISLGIVVCCIFFLTATTSSLDATIYQAPNRPFIVSRRFFGVVAPVMVPAFIAMYVLARITLLILACIELRALPDTKLVGIKWTSFFPHI